MPVPKREPYIDPETGLLITPAPDPAPPAEPKRRGAGKRRTRRRAWTQAQVWTACPAAVGVFMALRELADGRPVCTPTRAVLAERSGVKRLATISRALTVLVDAGWILRQLVPVEGGGQRVTLLRISICRRS